MGIYLSKQEAKEFGNEPVTCRIQHVFIDEAIMKVHAGDIYIYQNRFDGDVPLLMHPLFIGKFKYCWRWDDMVTEVQLVNKKGAINMADTPNILEELKTVGLGESDRLLRKYGLIDADGYPTEDGLKAASKKMFDKVRDELVEDIKAAEKLRKANKKSKKE